MLGCSWGACVLPGQAQHERCREPQSNSSSVGPNLPCEMAKLCGASVIEDGKQGGHWVQEELSRPVFTAALRLLTFLWMGVGTL